MLRIGSAPFAWTLIIDNSCANKRSGHARLYTIYVAIVLMLFIIKHFGSYIKEKCTQTFILFFEVTLFYLCLLFCLPYS